MKKNKEKITKSDVKYAVNVMMFVMLIIVISVCLSVFIDSLYESTNQLFFYFLLVLYIDSLQGVLVTFLFLVGILFTLKKEGTVLDAGKIFKGFFLVAFVWVLILNMFSVNKRYDDLLLDNEKPSRIYYKCQLLKDIFEQETELVELDAKQVKASINHYTYRMGRRGGTKSAKSYYVQYKTEENVIFASMESWELKHYVEAIQELDGDITIEYYPHSGVIKSVNGIAKTDTEALKNHLLMMTEDKEKKLQQEEAEALAKQEQERETNRRIRNILEQAVGQNIACIQEKFEEQKLPFSYEIKYVSSKMYNVGEITFYDKQAIYVVENQEQEDMVVFPRISQGTSKANIIRILTESGFNYQYDEFSCGIHEKGTLHTIHFGVGELVPKGYTVWFSVDE